MSERWRARAVSRVLFQPTVGIERGLRGPLVPSGCGRFGGPDRLERVEMLELPQKRQADDGGVADLWLRGLGQRFQDLGRSSASE